MSNTIQITSLYEHEYITKIDWYFSKMMQNLSDNKDPNLALGAALASYQIRAGHSCADLAQLADKLPLQQLETDIAADIKEQHFPALTAWLQSLKNSTVVGIAGEYKPLILIDSRLYLYRYWWYEQHIAKALKQRQQCPPSPYQTSSLKQDIAKLFPSDSDNNDWQQIAAITVVLQNFSVISGGPGTGKTTTVVKILALLLGQNPHLKIALSAPTGKAAMRLQSSIQTAKQQLPKALRNLIPDQTSTLHRLLGTKKHSLHFEHNSQKPLAIDVLLIDEVSMVDLAMMSKILQALPLSSRLILLGDKDQLSSIEAGSVLASICQATGDIGFTAPMANTIQALLPTNAATVIQTSNTKTLQDQVVYLQTSYRFTAQSDLGRFARAVNQGNSTDALAQIQNANPEKAVHCYHQKSLADLSKQLLKGFSAYLNSSDINQQLQRLQDFKVLCAYRQGERGVIQVNRFIRQLLHQHGLIKPQGRWYAGQPILITRNDYQHQLFNGDTGIIAPIPEDPDKLAAFFQNSDGSLRHLAPSRLPEHEEAYAMTIHKSQGSEFNQILIVLPQQIQPLLDRSLLYTGLTRARKQVYFLASHSVLSQMIQQQNQRHGGLSQALLS